MNNKKRLEEARKTETTYPVWMTNIIEFWKSTVGGKERPKQEVKEEVVEETHPEWALEAQTEGLDEDQAERLKKYAQEEAEA